MEDFASLRGCDRRFLADTYDLVVFVHGLGFTPLQIAVHIQILSAAGPFLVDFHKLCSHQPFDRFPIGKDAITRSRRRISSFKRARAGCAETPAVLFRQKRDRRRIFKTGFQDCHGFRRFRFVCLQNLIQEQPRRIQIRCVENGPYPAMYFILHSFRRGIQNIAQEVGLTPLPGDALEGFTDGPHQPAVDIRHNPIDASEPAAFQPAKKFTPTRFVPFRYPFVLPSARRALCKLSLYFGTKEPFFCTFLQKALSPFLKECAKFFVNYFGRENPSVQRRGRRT